MKTKVKNVMTKKLITLPMGSTLLQADQVMKEKRIRHLPIIDQNANIVGILSEKDLSFIKDPESIPVEFFMAHHVEFVDQEMPLRSVILKMLENKISSVLITDEIHEAVGIVTTDDLLWYLAHVLEKEKDDLSLSDFVSLQTIGEAANQISNVGL